MSCQIDGCREKAEYVRRGVVVNLAGHPDPVVLGDLKLCVKHERTTRGGGRTRIRDEVLTAALARR